MLMMIDRVIERLQEVFETDPESKLENLATLAQTTEDVLELIRRYRELAPCAGKSDEDTEDGFFLTKNT